LRKERPTLECLTCELLWQKRSVLRFHRTSLRWLHSNRSFVQVTGLSALYRVWALEERFTGSGVPEAS
jgi:hypothetical protein